MKTTIGIVAFATVAAGVVSVGALDLDGSYEMEPLVRALLDSSTLECGGIFEPTTDGVVGSLAYSDNFPEGGSAVGEAAMLAGLQDVAPMSLPMGLEVCPITLGTPEGIVFALDNVSLVAASTTVANAAGACNGSQVGCGVDSPGKGFRYTFSGGSGAVPLTSCTSSQITSWRDVLRFIYFGYDPTGTPQSCNSPCRNELANGYAKLFHSACTVGNSCTQLRHAFRQNEDSDGTEIFRATLGVPAPNHQDNRTPFCNSGTAGPEIAPVLLKPCAGAADCQADGAPGTGTCDTSAGSRTFHHCTKQTCNTAADCPTDITVHTSCGPTATAPLAAANVCQLEAITEPETNIADHNLQNCLNDADCQNGHACDLPTSQCLCASNADCAPGASCNPGAAFDGVSSACVPSSTATPQPSHIIETTTAYGPAGSWVDLQDADPIRRTCAFASGSPLEDVCNRDGKLGLVLPIWAPTTRGTVTPRVPPVAAADAFPAQACDPGKFACYAATRFGLDSNGNSIFDLCPDGSNPNLPPARNPNVCPQGQCLRPFHLGGATADPRCLNARGNLPPPLTIPPNDGRVYNLDVWQQLASGAFVLGRYPRATGQDPGTLFGSLGFVNMTGAFFRLHQNTPTISGAGACQQTSAANQIACFVQASSCSIGYTSNSAVQGAVATINVNNVTASDNTCTQNLLTKSVSDPTTFPLAHRMFLNAARGFQPLDPLHAQNDDQRNEYKLAQCFGLDDDGAPDGTGHGSHGEAQHIATTHDPFSGGGFVPLPSSVNGGQPYCDDVAADVCGLPPACSGNTGAIPTQTIPF